ncbi:MAG: DegQ family serine endoprotease [Deltaproteobacteria bacterium]|nr:DegQ family serine endoprotease [Deltaproteobacteria bacterium]
MNSLTLSLALTAISIPAFAELPPGLGPYTVADVAERVTPAVVNIATERSAPAQLQQNHPLFREFFGPQGRAPREMGAGSGVVISADGYIVTNNHVVDGSDQIKVVLSDKREFKAKLIGTDKASDVALIRIEAKNLQYVEFGDSGSLRLGEFVLAIGNPFGVGQTVTMGIVSAKGRANMGIVDYEDFIQTDAAINPGNSGGALVNLAGQLVGINTAILSRSGSAAGVGFAVPTSMVKPILDQIRQHGRVRRGWLGVAIQDLTPDLAKSLDLGDTKGALISDVMNGGPAAKAKIEAGDVVLEVNGQLMKDATQLRNFIALTAPGSDAKLVVLHEKRRKSIAVTLGEKPENETAEAATPPSDSIIGGLGLRDLDSAARNELKVPPNMKGVVVVNVEPGTAAEQAGMRPGDVITGVNQRGIASVEDLDEMKLDQKDRVLLRVWRQGHFIFVVLKK